MKKIRFFAWIAFRLLIGASGTVGYAFAIKELIFEVNPITEDPLFIVIIGVITGLLFIGATACGSSCLYWPEFDKEGIKT